MGVCSLKDVLCLEYLLCLKFTPDLNILENNCCLLELQQVAGCAGHILSLQEPDQIKKNGLLLPYLDCSCHFYAFQFGTIFASLWVMNQFLLFKKIPYTLNTTTSTWVIYSYFQGKCSDEVHFAFQSVQPFTAKTHYAMNTGAICARSRRIPLVRRMFLSNSFFVRIEEQNPEKMIG